MVGGGNNGLPEVRGEGRYFSGGGGGGRNEQVRLQKCVGRWRGLVWSERGLMSGLGGNGVLLFLMPTRSEQGGGGGTQAEAESDVKRDVGTNNEEIKLREDKV